MPIRRRLATHTAAFAVGVVTALATASHARDGKSDRYKTLDAFAHSISLIRRNYVDTVSERKLIYTAIDGMVEGLDRHSSFYAPKRYRRLRQDTQGAFGGVGLTLRAATEEADPPYPVVDEVIPGSPAALARIAVGDEVLAIDGTATAVAGDSKRRGRSLHTKLRGPENSKVRLDVRPKGASPRRVEMTRRRVKVPSVSAWGFGDGLGYIRVRRFQEATTRDLLASLKTLGGAKLRGLVLDLRNNPGGLFDQAVLVADLFIDSGVIVQVIGRGQRVLERPMASRRGTRSRLPIVVLVDNGTASAAEIVAAALKDHGRAKLFGKRTFGKGSVQTFFDLPDGAGLKLTTARYVSPSGTVIHGTGIEPSSDIEAFEGDVFVAGGGAEETTVRVKWPHLTAKLSERLDSDFQLREAYSALRSEATR